jgi:hypothetical protein
MATSSYGAARIDLPDTVAPPVFSRAKTEADRWLLVQELEISTFNGRHKTASYDDDLLNAAAPALSRSKSWWRRSIGNNDKYMTAQMHTTKTLPSMRRTKSKSNADSGAFPSAKTSDMFDTLSPACEEIETKADGGKPRLVSSRRRHSLGHLSKQTSPTKSHRVDLEIKQEKDEFQNEIMPAPTSLGQRKSSFFGRLKEVPKKDAPPPSTPPKQVRKADELARPQVPTKRLSHRPASPMELHSISSRTGNGVTPVAPPSLSRKPSLFGRLFTRRKPRAKLNSVSESFTSNSSELFHAPQNKRTAKSAVRYNDEASVGSYDEVYSFDLPLPDSLVTTEQRMKLTEDECSYDRWSPVPEITPESVSAPKQPTRLTNSPDVLYSTQHTVRVPTKEAPKQPIRQDSVQKNIAAVQQLKQGLLQEIDRVDNLLDAFARHSPLPEETKQSMAQDYDEDSESSHSGSESLISGLLSSWAANLGNEDFGLCAVVSEAPGDGKYSGCVKAVDASKPNASVRFDRIIIREYERCIGDNPSCSSGRTFRKPSVCRVSLFNNFVLIISSR